MAIGLDTLNPVQPGYHYYRWHQERHI